MNCKYCHLKTHYIDKCPTIICKSCKEIGHPQWLCKDKKSNNNHTHTHNVKNNKGISLDKKYNFSDEIKKKSSDIVLQKNMNYYIKLSDEKWSDLITI